MSKKIVAIFLLMTILFSNCALAVEESLKYTREGGNNLYEVASEYNKKIYINNIQDYATSIRVDYTKVKVYNYNSNVEKKCVGEKEIPYSNNKDSYFLSSSVFRDGKKSGQKLFGDGDQYLFYTIALDEGAVNEKNVATFIYEDAIKFKGQTYNVKLNIKEINKIGSSNNRVKVLIACRDESDKNLYDITTYNKKFEPAIGMDRGNDYKAEISVEYFIVDKNGNETPFNGMLEVSDLDQYQGLVIRNFKASRDNAFIEKAFDTVKYKYVNDSNDFFVYTTVPGNLDGEKDTYYDYFLLNNRNKVDMVFTFDTVPAHSSILFNTDMMATYKEIITEVVGGIITPNITNIKYGEDKTVSYSPNNPERQYIKSITVDGKEVELSKDNKDSYTFSNVTENHKITVVYGDRYKVEYDAKGGIPTPATEYVEPSNKATEPTTNPAKRGYTFEGWVKTGDTTKYDFNTPVNSDIKLEAEWKPIIYRINYVLNGGTNDPRNPDTYTIDSNIIFQPATREGYDFLGWYEDPEFTKPIDSISNRTGDVTIYAKWQAKQNIPFKVEHYLESDNGDYKLTVTENLSGEINQKVIARVKTFEGYKENTTHPNRLSEGTVLADGSLVLKLYYNRLVHTVTFDPQNGNHIDDQKVRDKDKATEPEKQTKDGYEFEYWYYIDEEGKEVKYNFDDPVTRDIDLIAKWKKLNEPAKEPAQDNTKKDGEIPYTGKTMLVVNLIIATLAGFGIVTLIRYKKNKPEFFRSL